MTITLPDELREGAERKARAAGFDTVADYVCWLLQEPDETTNEYTPQDLGFESQEALDAHLQKSLDSGPPILVTPEFWEQLRLDSAARAEQLKGQK